METLDHIDMPIHSFIHSIAINSVCFPRDQPLLSFQFRLNMHGCIEPYFIPRHIYII